MSDFYHDNSNQQRSPTHRHQSHTVQRQPSRPFDVYSAMPQNPMFSNDDQPQQQQQQQQQQQRFPPGYPDRMNATLGPNYNNYDTWGGPLGTSQFSTLGGAGSRMNSNRGGLQPPRRLPSVCIPPPNLVPNTTNSSVRHGLTKHCRHSLLSLKALILITWTT
jgi:hypothetical protein